MASRSYVAMLKGTVAAVDTGIKAGKTGKKSNAPPIKHN